MNTLSLQKLRCWLHRSFLLLFPIGLLDGHAVLAQSTIAPRVAWAHEAYVSPVRYGPFSERSFRGLLQLSPTRFVQVGSVGYYNEPSVPNVFFGISQCIFFNAAGDTTGGQTYRALAPEVGCFFDGIAKPDGTYLSFTYSSDSTGGWFFGIYQFDSLGTLQWQKRHYTANRIPTWGTPVALPDGFLLPLILNTRQASGSYQPAAGVTKFDWQGNEQWDWRAEPQSTSGRSTSSYSAAKIAVCRDGAYALTYQSVARAQPVTNVVFDLDNRIIRFTANGDTLASTWFGEPNWQDIGFFTTPTQDGGFLVCGSRRYRYPLGANHPRQAYLFKFDSTLRMQWEKRLYPPVRSPDAGCDLVHVQELTNGHIRAVGWMNIPDGPTYFQIEGLVAEIVPPSGSGLPGDSAQVVLQWLNPVAFPDNVLSQPDGSAIVDGYSLPSRIQAGENRYRGRWSGLGIPAPYDLCRTPPTLEANAVTYTGPGGPNGNAFTFTLDATKTHAGPRYGVVSLVVWTYSDGAPADTGYVVTRTFAAPTPVRVTCTVYNNLNCRVSTEVYPFGPCPCPLAAPAPVPTPPQVSVYPNPSATGIFAVRGAAGATATVVDALGRIVWAGKLDNAPEARLSLATEAAGLYALRLTWPDGRALTKRLVK